MQSRYRLLFCLLAVPLAFVSGCGGGSSGQTRTTTVPVKITWAQLRAGATDLTGAQSAHVVLKTANADGTDAVMDMNRTLPTASTDTVPLKANGLKAGSHDLVVTLFNAVNGSTNPSAVVVGVAGQSLPISQNAPATAPAAPIVLTATVATVSIAPSQTVAIGKTAPLTVVTLDSSNNVVPIAVSDAAFQVVSGTDKVQIVNVTIPGQTQTQQQVEGLAAGTATLTVTVKGIVSQTVSVTVAPPPAPPDVSNLVAQARTLLNTLLAGQTQPSSSTVKPVLDAFYAAYMQNPTDDQAAFGFAISTVGYNGDIALEKAQGKSVAIRTGITRDASAPDPLTNLAQTATFWSTSPLDQGTTYNVLNLLLAAPTLTTSLSGSTRAVHSRVVVDPVALRAAISNLKLALDQAIPPAEFAANKPGFTFVIADFRKGAAAGATITIDQGEAQTYVTALYAARAVINMALSYDTNPGSVDLRQPISTAFATQVAAMSDLTPAIYVPAKPFGTLLPDGPSRFLSAQSDLGTMVDRALTTLDTLRARPVATGHLFDASKLDFSTIQTELKRFKTELTQQDTRTVTVTNDVSPDQDILLTFNLNAWFSNPPADLRILVPTYHYSQPSGQSFFNYVATVADFPDKTLGGLLISPDASIFSASVFGGSIDSTGISSGDTTMRLITSGPLGHIRFHLSNQGGANIGIQ